MFRRQRAQKKPHPKAGLKNRWFCGEICLFAGALGSLDRVDLGLLFGGVGLDVGGQIADPVSPFQGRFRRGTAVGPAVVGHDPVAAIALFNNGMATPAAKSAALFFHKRAFHAIADGCADHTLHLLII